MYTDKCIIFLVSIPVSLSIYICLHSGRDDINHFQRKRNPGLMSFQICQTHSETKGSSRELLH